LPLGRSLSAQRAERTLALFLFALAGACGGSGGGGGQSGTPGQESQKANGDFFIIDENQSGGATDLHLAEVRWGRLVDIHQSDANGVRIEKPVYRDFVINPSIGTNPNLKLVLDRNPVTQRERLTIQNPKGPDASDPPNSDLFAQRLTEVGVLPLVLVKGDENTSPPFTTVARNACMVLRFDDCLQDGSSAELNLATMVRVFTGYPPTTPFAARVIFDPNHGAIASSDFHSTRVLVDMTVSSSEASNTTLAVNQLGLPPRLSNSDSTNLAVRIPSAIDVGTSQFQVLTNLSGVPMDFNDNGPVDPTSSTLDIVRAAQSGSSEDVANGFLADEDQPSLVGGWPITVVDQTPVGTEGFDFFLDLSFTKAACQSDPEVGDVVQVNGAFLVVTVANTRVGNAVNGLAVRSPVALVDDGNPNTVDILPEDLIGPGIFQAPFVPALVTDGCWVTFLPEATTFPVTGVSTNAQLALRFSEPMDPATLTPLSGFLVVNDEPSGAVTTPNSQNLVVGSVLPNGDLTVFSYDPSAALPHVIGDPSSFHVQIGAVTDLAGNSLLHQLNTIAFNIDALAPTETNDAIVLRFDSPDNDEYAPNGDPGAVGDGLHDLRGQFFLDSGRGTVRGRDVALTGWPIDRTNRVPAAMTALPGGLLTPLNPLGVKLQMLWRYADAGWHPLDETKYNLDVIGLSWSPLGGLVQADFFDLFEIRLGHSRFLPDEACCSTMTPTGGTSGLPSSPSTFEANFLAGSNPTIVHNRALGYTISSANVFNSTTGTPMIPFPLNRGLTPDVTYTYRDTSILTLGGGGDAAQPGIPTQVEVKVGTPSIGAAGSIAPVNRVPSFGLPLLIEIKCFPSDRGLGLNRFDASNAIFGLITPGFRAYSAGGVNNLGIQTQVLPDAQTTPIGAFNPTGNLPGADNIFYLGQLDTVVRVSRVHTVWLDAGAGASPGWQTPILEALRPTGTSIDLAFRSAIGFTGNAALTAPFDADRLDPYGNPLNSNDFGVSGETDWSNDISIGNTQRYLQVRLSFVNNITSGVGPELSALALPYDL
jgi:hypothetical protein